MSKLPDGGLPLTDLPKLLHLADGSGPRGGETWHNKRACVELVDEGLLEATNRHGVGVMTRRTKVTPRALFNYFLSFDEAVEVAAQHPAVRAAVEASLKKEPA